jgi:cytochrome d ubiquinol oxidase subunit I
VAGASNLSAIWILIANGWMQHPVGYAVKNGRAEVTDFAAVVFNKFGILQILHMLPAALVLASFFVMGISAYHLLKKQNVEFFTKSFHLGLVFGFIFSIVIALEGDFHARNVTETQPAKLAAMESLWETTEGAPMYLFILPDEKNEKNSIEIGAIPGLLSFLGHHDFNAEVTGLKDIPKDERPPVLLAFLSFRIMVALGTLFPILTLIGLFPNMFPSNIDPSYSLTAHNSASSALTLKIMLVVVILFVPIVLIYQAWAYNLFKGKVSQEDLHY